MEPKAYNAVVMLMVFVTLCVVITNTNAYFSTVNISVANDEWKTRIYILLVFWPLLLSGETVFYGLVRKRLKKALLVWGHVFCNIICFFLIPIVQTFLFAYFEPTEGLTEYAGAMLKIDQIRLFIFWPVIIIGHAFFITTIANIFRRKDTFDTDNEQPPGILDGILDEY